MAAARFRLRPAVGMSLVELLVGMLILGALASIALPIFLNQRASTEEKVVQANLRTVVQQLQLHLVDVRVWGDEPTLVSGQATMTLDLGDGGQFDSGTQSVTFPAPADLDIVDTKVGPGTWCIVGRMETVYGRTMSGRQDEVGGAPQNC